MESSYIIKITYYSLNILSFVWSRDAHVRSIPEAGGGAPAERQGGEEEGQEEKAGEAREREEGGFGSRERGRHKARLPGGHSHRGNARGGQLLFQRCLKLVSTKLLAIMLVCLGSQNALPSDDDDKDPNDPHKALDIDLDKYVPHFRHLQFICASYSDVHEFIFYQN